MDNRHNQKRILSETLSFNAFTRLELLVVMAILITFFMMIRPTFSQYGESRRRMVCVDNLRQIGMAFNEYSIDHDDTFPAGGSSTEAFLMLTNGNYLLLGSVYHCASDNKTLSDSSGIDALHNSYACVMAESDGSSGLSASMSNEQPLIFDRDIVGEVKAVNDLISKRWPKTAPHRDCGGNIFYVGGQCEFKETFDCGTEGTNGFIFPP